MKNLFFLLVVSLFIIKAQAQEAVCAWDRIPLLIAPDKTSAQVGSVRFGTDIVKTSYETITVQEDYKRTYVRITLADGTQGWINQYLLVPNGEAGVIKYDIDLYQNPVDGVTKVKGGALTAGDPVIKTEFNGAYVHILTKNKEKSGWIPAEGIVFGKEEVINALLLQKAKAEKDPQKRTKRIQEIRNQASFTGLQIAGIIDGEYTRTLEVAERGALAENTNPIYRTENTPTTMRGEAGDTPPKMSERVTAPSLNTNQQYIQVGNELYQRNMSFLPIIEAVIENMKTPEFACYHKTLPIGTKINMYFPDNKGFVELEVVENLRNYEGLGLSPAQIKRFFSGNPPENVAIQYFTKAELTQ